jgi:hypothetical protein
MNLYKSRVNAFKFSVLSFSSYVISEVAQVLVSILGKMLRTILDPKNSFKEALERSFLTSSKSGTFSPPVVG